MAGSPEVLVVGAGILGLASAYHILKGAGKLDLLVIDRLGGPGLGNTARSAAAYRDMFSSPVNRDLSQGAIAFYEKVQAEAVLLGLKRIGYLWLLTGAQMEKCRRPLDSMARAGVKFETLDAPQLGRSLPGLRLGDISQGLLGMNCGILNPNLLARYYEDQILIAGGRFAYKAEVTGLAADGKGRIIGVRVGRQEIIAETVVIATGAWMSLTMALAGLKVPVVPRKRQLFSIPAREGPLLQLFNTRGFNAHNLLPFTIVPGGAYLRPATRAIILGYANADQPPGLEDHPAAERDFFEQRIRSQVEQYFPAFQGVAPEHGWAGHYADHPADMLPFIDRVGGAIAVGGDSGSGIMKADSLGRIAAGLFLRRERVELGNGRLFPVAALELADRTLSPEEFII